MKIKIKINELIFEGFNYHECKRLSTVIEDEFSILARNNDIKKLSSKDVASTGTLLHLRSNDIKVVGAEVARSIFSTAMGQ
jgi:hypothetical protein